MEMSRTVKAGELGGIDGLIRGFRLRHTVFLLVGYKQIY